MSNQGLAGIWASERGIQRAGPVGGPATKKSRAVVQWKLCGL